MSLDCVNKMADYLKYFSHFVLKISLDLMKSSEVKKAGERSNYYPIDCRNPRFLKSFNAGQSTNVCMHVPFDLFLSLENWRSQNKH